MCFSTEASFSAALVLGAMGGITMKNCSSRSQFFLAAVPFLFAIQQFAEGILWLQLSHHQGSDIILRNAQWIFLSFAFLIWPIWVPLSLVAVEKVGWRRLIIAIDLACGIALSLLNLSYAVQQETSVRIVNHSLQYIGNVPEQTLIYPIIVLLPCFLSSIKNMWMFGVIVAMGYIAADYFYNTTFVSVWCFFAAIASVLNYKILKDNQIQVETTLPN